MTSRTWRDLVAAAAALLLLVVGAWRELAAFPGDERARRWVFEHPRLPSGVADVSDVLSAAGTPAVALLTLALAVWAVRRRWGGREAAGVAVAALAVVAAELSQDVLGQGAGQLVPTAYPSGHVTWATSVLGFLVLRGRRHGVPELVVPAVVVVVLMGPERVVTGAHGISDVLGGYGLGVAWALLTDRWAGEVSPSRASR